MKIILNTSAILAVIYVISLWIYIIYSFYNASGLDPIKQMEVGLKIMVLGIIGLIFPIILSMILTIKSN